MFKVGDKVRIVKEWAGFGLWEVAKDDSTVGKIGTVKEVSAIGVKVLIDSSTDCWWYYHDGIELIGNEKEKETINEDVARIAVHYGKNPQRIKLCEECAELIQAAIKGDEKHIAEEIADVEIMIEQMKMLYGLDGIVEEFKKIKIARQLARMKEER